MKRLNSYLTATVASLSLLAGMLTAVPAFAQSEEDLQPSSEELMIAELVADAQGSSGTEEKHHHWIHLSDDQLERMVALKDRYETSTAAKRAQLHSAERQLKEGMTAAAIDRKQLASLNDSINLLHTDLGRARFDYMVDRAEVLTAEQRSGLHHMMLIHEAMGGHGGFCHGGGHKHWGGWGHHGMGEHDKGTHRGPERASEDGANSPIQQEQS